MPNTLVALSFHAGAQPVMRQWQHLAVASRSTDESKLTRPIKKAARELER